MLSKVSHLLIDNYGYEVGTVLTHRHKDVHDVFLHSGPVSILLIDDKDSGVLTMKIIENEMETTTKIRHDETKYEDIVLSSLLNFALHRLPGNVKQGSSL